MPSDITLPARITIDRDSRYAMLGAAFNNAFCGLMSVPDGVIYVAPYTQMLSRPAWDPATVEGFTEYLGDASCAGVRLSTRFAGGKIYHQENGVAGHEQLADFLASAAGVHSSKGYVGFSIVFGPMKGGFGSTSRSQNNQHFRAWSGEVIIRDRVARAGTQDMAFQAYHASTGGVQGAPNFHDVTTPSAGRLPDDWSAAIRNALRTEIGKDYVNLTDGARVSAVVDRSSVPPAPAPPPI